MKVLVTLALALVVAGSACAAVDSFDSYANGNLNGNGAWTGSDAGNIVVQNGSVKITSNATGKTEANLAVTPAAANTYVGFSYKQAAGAAPEFFADVYVYDEAGAQLGWMYAQPEGFWDNGGTPTFAQGQVRGRTGGTITTYWETPGDYGWHNFYMQIGATTTSYFVDGTLMGTLANGGNANSKVAKIQLTSWNRGHANSSGYFDNVYYGSSVVTPEPSSLAAFGVFGMGLIGTIRRRRS